MIQAELMTTGHRDDPLELLAVITVAQNYGGTHLVGLRERVLEGGELGGVGVQLLLQRL